MIPLHGRLFADGKRHESTRVGRRNISASVKTLQTVCDVTMWNDGKLRITVRRISPDGLRQETIFAHDIEREGV